METVLKVAQSISGFIFAMAIGLALGAISSKPVVVGSQVHAPVPMSSFGELRIKEACVARADVVKRCGGRHVC